MSARSSVAANVCPFLTRLVLGVTFVWFGLPKFKAMEFRGAQAQALIDMGVVPAPAGGAPTTATPPDAQMLPGADEGDAGETDIEDPNTPADEAAEEETGTPDEPDSPPAGGDGGEEPGGATGADDSARASADADNIESRDDVVSLGLLQDDPDVAPLPDLVEEEQPDPSAIDPDDEIVVDDDAGAGAAAPMATQATVDPNLTVKALGLHNITLLLRDVNHVYPVLFAWVGALTELLGGALILIGLLSRVWGLGLAIAMGYAFYLTAVPALAAAFDAAATDPALNTYEALRGIDFNMQAGLFWQVALFVLAFNIFIGGPGAMSLDRILFGRGRSAQRVTVDED